nr:immunoglobulin heavy chain junction region [Macaca mulatta]MOW89138.1 immunoglobulin heavy chain junction region [Macaca mulatta]MOW89264.1 immunoglobulin heavy chain junction region [Macaca mulatta]MOW90140.1 immunoglobulin heavy chain junction region [Macaca mulatta]MOW90227.1 immunoglobulin heavy chain junction region [Macaca mulatta]
CARREYSFNSLDVW